MRSVRSAARQEYSKVYTVLAPFYFDIVMSKTHTESTVFQKFHAPIEQAQMLAQLRAFAKSDLAIGADDREQLLQATIGVFEDAALREFEL